MVKNLPTIAGGTGFDTWVRKMPWSRKWQPTPVFLPGKSHRQRSLAGYSPWVHKESTGLDKETTTMRKKHCFLNLAAFVYWSIIRVKCDKKRSLKHSTRKSEPGEKILITALI